MFPRPDEHLVTAGQWTEQKQNSRRLGGIAFLLERQIIFMRIAGSPVDRVRFGADAGARTQGGTGKGACGASSQDGDLGACIRERAMRSGLPAQQCQCTILPCEFVP
mmetsp:Transcript_93/g.190  ORF Transcript_93/g.190 Transcript_93/m.190 type:complete len:107 (+) Transcript_93:371-691(+)